MNKLLAISAISLAIVLTVPTEVSARDWYVSVDRGKGKKGTKEKPAKDLGNLLKKLEPGDVIHIAEGTYLGKGKNGSTTVTVPVSIIGGYSNDFSKRDPWGKHRTIFSGENKTKNYKMTSALRIDLNKVKAREGLPGKIVVDGLILDHGARNRYKTEKQWEIARKANPKTGENPTPESGALIVSAGKNGMFDKIGWDIRIENCIVMNSAPTMGAMSISGYKRSKVVIRNNVLAFADRHIIYNPRSTTILLQNNIMTGSMDTEYLEFDTKIALEDIEDEPDEIHEDSEENEAKSVKVPINSDWLKLYGSRVLVDRNKAETNIKASETRANALRRMLGMAQRAGKVDFPTSPVWLPRLSVDDAVKAGSKQYHGVGSKMPKP